MIILDSVDERTLTQLHMPVHGNWGTGTIILNNKNQILLGMRTDNRLWGTPGGKVEPGETVLSGAKREVKEECNLRVNNLKCYGTHVGAYKNNKMWISFMFICKDFSGEVKPQKSEMSGWVWLYPDEIKTLELFEPTRRSLEKAGELKLIKW